MFFILIKEYTLQLGAVGLLMQYVCAVMFALYTLSLMKLQNYNAKLSDFGLAKDGPTGDKSHVSTRVMGTYGYAAPEYLATGMD